MSCERNVRAETMTGSVILKQSLRDGARAARTSTLFYKGASTRFRQLLKKGINRAEIERPIEHFKKNPKSREFYVTFDEDDKQYVRNLNSFNCIIL